jgi:hypothetical protein
MNKEIIPQVGDVWSCTYKVLGVHENMVWYDCIIDIPNNDQELLNTYDFIKNYKLTERDGKPYVAIPQGKDLIGTFCGVSSSSLEKAKYCAEQLVNIRIISTYDSRHTNTYGSPYLDNGGQCWLFAYPVSKQQLLELAEKAK